LRRSRLARGQAVPAKDVAETLACAPEDLVELHVRQLQRLSNHIPRLFMEVIPFQHFAVTLHGQVHHEIANRLRELLVVESLFHGQSLVLEIRQQFAIIVVLP
jgi:hypothetical protein